jgi:transposase-like protein
MEIVHVRCAGLDISKRDAKVCVRVGGAGRRKTVETVTTWGSTTNQVLALRDHLIAEQVRCAVMEATGDYWKPFYYLLEDAGFEVLLVNARHVKNLPGRKTDVSDATWLAQLGAHGLVRGWSIRAAAREVRGARTTGANWARGYKTYRNGTVVGFVPPLERLAVRQVSPRFLSQDERIEIADLRQAALSVREIALKVGRTPSTISRELRRNASGRRGYRPFQAHRMTTTRRVRDHRRRVETNIELRELIAELLTQRWSPRSRAAATCVDSSPTNPRCMVRVRVRLAAT